MAHLRAEEYTKYGYVEKEIWEQYFTFAVVRNPYDRMVSFMNWYDYDSLEKFLTRKLLDAWQDRSNAPESYYFVRSQYDYIFSKDGELLVDRVLCFENLSDEFGEIKELLSLSSELPFSNNSREMGEGYRKYYNDKCKNIVKSYYGKDLETWSYSF